MTTRVDTLNEIREKQFKELKEGLQEQAEFLKNGKGIAETSMGKEFFNYILNNYYKPMTRAFKRTIEADAKDLYNLGYLIGIKNLLDDIIIPFIEKEKFDGLLTNGEKNGE